MTPMRILPLLLISVVGLGLASCDRHAVRAARGVGHAERAERQAGQGHGLKRACRADIEQYCVASQKGRERRQCLQSHIDKLSEGCKQAMTERGNRHGGGRKNRDSGAADDSGD